MNASDLSLIRTFSTLYSAPDVRLSPYAALFSKAVRSAFALFERDARKGTTHTQAELKSSIGHDFDLTSRQAYSVLVEAQARRDSLLELGVLELGELEDRCKKQRGKVARGKALLAAHKKGKTLRLTKAKRASVKQEVFYAQTQVAKLKAAIQSLKARLELGTTTLVFGTKKALRQKAALLLEKEQACQNADFVKLAETDEALARWRAGWDLSRSGQFLVVGSKDETAGCQGCVARIEQDGSVTLTLKMPPALGGERVVLSGLRFAHGMNHLRHALGQQTLRAVSRKVQNNLAQEAAAVAALSFVGPIDPNAKARTGVASQKKVEGGVALTWRFMKQAEGGWRISFATSIPVALVVTNFKNGAIGVDLNAGFLSVAETDGCGNILSVRNYPTPDIGKSAHQRAAIQGDVVKAVMARCLATSKPLVLESLDFTRKKRDLRQRAPESRRKLSSLAYSSIFQLFVARSRDSGVEVVTIDPAYTSTQGWLRYASLRGWTVHQAAAGVIARRGQGFSEAAPVSGKLRVPVGAVVVELAVPVETVKSDISCRWQVLHRALQQAIALHYRARRRARQAAARQKAAGDAVVPGEIPGLKLRPK